MHPEHGPHLPVTWKPSNPFTWSVSEGSLESSGMILSVTLRSLYALVSHLCPTGLPEVAMPYSDMWQDCQITLQHTKPCYARSSYRSVDPQTLHGKVPQVDHVPNGPTNSAMITTFPLRLCGVKPLVAVTREWQVWADYVLTTTMTSLQTDNHTNTSSLNFYRLDVLPDAQPTVSKHWRHATHAMCHCTWYVQ